jgi:hypothetical protein
MGTSATLSLLAAPKTLVLAPVFTSTFMPCSGATSSRTTTGPISTPPPPGMPRPLRYSSRMSSESYCHAALSSRLNARLATSMAGLPAPAPAAPPPPPPSLPPPSPLL